MFLNLSVLCAKNIVDSFSHCQEFLDLLDRQSCLIVDEEKPAVESWFWHTDSAESVTNSEVFVRYQKNHVHQRSRQRTHSNAIHGECSAQHVK